MKKTEIQKIAAQVFKKVPKAEKAFITSDGYGFSNKNSAVLHQRTNSKGKKISLYEANKVVATAEAEKEKPKTTKKKTTTKSKTTKKATPENRQVDDLASDVEKEQSLKVEEEKANEEEKEESKEVANEQSTEDKSTPIVNGTKNNI